MMNPPLNPNEEPERTKPFPGPNAQRRPQTYKFTPEELEVLRQCNRESFFQRCVPLSTILGAATFYAIKTGKIAGNKNFGAVPKVTLAAVIGFFLGKFSYQQKCAEKFMALPDSKIGHLIRARRAGFHDDRDPASVPSISLSPFSGMADSYTDIPQTQNGTYDYDTRPTPEGLDDSFRPSVDNPIILHEEELPPEQKHVTTYDELRKKNRDEYEQKRLAIYRETRLPKTSPSQSPPSPATTEDTQVSDGYKPSAQTKTKYGDVWG